MQRFVCSHHQPNGSRGLCLLFRGHCYPFTFHLSSQVLESLEETIEGLGINTPQNFQLSTTVTAPRVTTAVRGDLKVCTRMFRDFPNSLDNAVICNRVDSEGKKLNWVRSNRALCEESKDFFDNFISKSCGPLWCEDASFKIDGSLLTPLLWVVARE